MTTPATANATGRASTDNAGDAARVSGVAVVDRIFFRSGDFFVASVNIPSETSAVTLKGKVGSSALFPGSRFNFAGRWVTDKKFGPQIEAHQIHDVEAPADEASVVRALATLPGIGPAKALAIIKDVGGPRQAATILADRPEELLETPTFARMPAAQREDFRRQVVDARLETTARAMMAKLGFMSGTFASAVAWAGDVAKLLKALTERPYSIAKVRGISFSRLDESLVRAEHAAVNSPARADGILEAAFDAEALGRGNTALTETMLVDAIDRLKLCRPLDERDYAGALRRALGSGRVVSLSRFADEVEADRDLGLLAGAEWYRAEERVARMVAVLFERWRIDPIVGADEPMPPLCDPDLDDAQRQAVETMFRSPVSVLTGGAGTGKTRLIKALLELARSRGALLAAPTGKAARRISEVTGEDALTIHRAASKLAKEADEGSGSFGPTTIIVDESSMISSDVMDLLAALVVNPRCRVRRLVFCGDDGQLPPVGPGAPMRDLMESGRIAVEKLARTYRQHGRSASALLAAAGSVSRGEFPQCPAPERPGVMIGTNADFVGTILKAADTTPTAIRDAAIEAYWRVVAERGPTERDIVLLVPQRTGRCGAVELNDALRRRWRGIRPDAVLDNGSKVESDSFLVDDRVVWTSNHYDCGAMNGDIGTVAAIETAPERKIVIALDSGQTVVAATREHFLSLRLAYALTVHRSQGSEWPYVVSVLSPDHFALLSRRLAYVALTRARILGVLATSAKALGMALAREMPGGDVRSTALPEILARTLPS